MSWQHVQMHAINTYYPLQKKKKRNNVHKNESHKIFLAQDGSHFGTINYEHLPRDTRVLD